MICKAKIMLCCAQRMSMPRRWSLSLRVFQSPGPVTSGLEHPHSYSLQHVVGILHFSTCARMRKLLGSTSIERSLAHRIHSVHVSSLYLWKECGLSVFLIPKCRGSKMLWALPDLRATLLKITKDLTMAPIHHHTKTTQSRKCPNMQTQVQGSRGSQWGNKKKCPSVLLLNFGHLFSYSFSRGPLYPGRKGVEKEHSPRVGVSCHVRVPTAWSPWPPCAPCSLQAKGRELIDTLGKRKWTHVAWVLPPVFLSGADILQKPRVLNSAHRTLPGNHPATQKACCGPGRPVIRGENPTHFKL